MALSGVRIEDITGAIAAGRVFITDHDDEEANADDLSFDEIYHATLHGEIIESYPADRPYPSCLIFVEIFSGEPVHTVWAYNAKGLHAVLITVYRPDPALWVNYRERRRG